MRKYLCFHTCITSGPALGAKEPIKTFLWGLSHQQGLPIHQNEQQQWGTQKWCDCQLLLGIGEFLANWTCLWAGRQAGSRRVGCLVEMLHLPCSPCDWHLGVKDSMPKHQPQSEVPAVGALLAAPEQGLSRHLAGIASMSCGHSLQHRHQEACWVLAARHFVVTRGCATKRAMCKECCWTCPAGCS